jgi:uncharacterized protein
MSLEIIRKSDQITSAWSGGTTTQLYIYPENSSYQERNFLFRISTATVDTVESVFTRLPGVFRQLMILDGSLKIDHTGRYSKILNKFETDSFEGDWETKGFGKVTDFNLMTKGSLVGSLYCKLMNNDENHRIISGGHNQFIGLYPHIGKLSIETEKKNLTINQRDFLIIRMSKNSLPVNIRTMEKTELIISRIHLTD